MHNECHEDIDGSQKPCTYSMYESLHNIFLCVCIFFTVGYPMQSSVDISTCDTTSALLGFGNIDCDKLDIFQWMVLYHAHTYSSK